MLRHFQQIGEGARECLHNRGYDDDEIGQGLRMPGSKFHASFAMDLHGLISRLPSANIVSENKKGKYLQRVFEFDAMEFPHGIGLLGVLPLNTVLEMEHEGPVQQLNRGQLLWHAKILSLPSTHLATMVLKEQRSADFLITMFPGSPAPPIPQPSMNPSEYEVCKAFWDAHVFLETYQGVAASSSV